MVNGVASHFTMLAVSLRNQIFYPGRIGSEFGNISICASETVWLRVTNTAIPIPAALVPSCFLVNPLFDRN